MAKLCEEQALDWQNKVLRYTWVPFDLRGQQLSDLEASLIRAEAPMLNRQHLPRFPTPQLRDGKPYQRARARWLWHTSWASVLLGVMPESVWDEWAGTGADGPGSDSLGYPSRRAAANSLWGIDIFDWPEEPEDKCLHDLMVHCARDAPATTRRAVAATVNADELWLWFAAHAAASIIGSSLEEALAATLQGATEHEFGGPANLPSNATMKELLTIGYLRFPRGHH